jgi:hypothetical protein
MASQTRQAREADRKLSVQTLAVASISSALAAIIVSQFWKGGTAPAAAVTPVVVSVISELLHKPARAITSRVTTDRAAILPEGAGAGAPAQRERTGVSVAADTETTKPVSEERPPPLHDEEGEAKPSDTRPTREAPISYHRSGSNGSSAKPGERSWRDRINLKIVAVTAALAFVIGAAILTVPELVSGGSVGKTDGGTTLFGGRGSSQDTGQDSQDTQDQQQDQPSDQGSGGSSGDSGQSQEKQGSGQTQQQKAPETEKQTTQQQQQRAPATPQSSPAEPK